MQWKKKWCSLSSSTCPSAPLCLWLQSIVQPHASSRCCKRAACRFVPFEANEKRWAVWPQAGGSARSQFQQNTKPRDVSTSRSGSSEAREYNRDPACIGIFLWIWVFLLQYTDVVHLLRTSPAAAILRSPWWGSPDLLKTKWIDWKELTAGKCTYSLM